MSTPTYEPQQLTYVIAYVLDEEDWKEEGVEEIDFRIVKAFNLFHAIIKVLPYFDGTFFECITSVFPLDNGSGFYDNEKHRNLSRVNDNYLLWYEKNVITDRFVMEGNRIFQTCLDFCLEQNPSTIWAVYRLSDFLEYEKQQAEKILDNLL